MLYYFKSEEDFRRFFIGAQSANTAQGQIDLESVVGVRVSGRRDLPSGGRGIELVAARRTWVVC